MINRLLTRIAGSSKSENMPVDAASSYLMKALEKRGLADPVETYVIDYINDLRANPGTSDAALFTSGGTDIIVSRSEDNAYVDAAITVSTTDNYSVEVQQRYHDDNTNEVNVVINAASLNDLEKLRSRIDKNYGMNWDMIRLSETLGKYADPLPSWMEGLRYSVLKSRPTIRIIKGWSSPNPYNFAMTVTIDGRFPLL